MDVRLHLKVSFTGRCTYINHDNSVNTDVNCGHKMAMLQRQKFMASDM